MKHMDTNSSSVKGRISAMSPEDVSLMGLSIFQIDVSFSGKQHEASAETSGVDTRDNQQLDSTGGRYDDAWLGQDVHVLQVTCDVCEL